MESCLKNAAPFMVLFSQSSDNIPGSTLVSNYYLKLWDYQSALHNRDSTICDKAGFPNLGTSQCVDFN